MLLAGGLVVALAVECEGRQITTVEGLAHENRLHVHQQKFIEAGAAQNTNGTYVTTADVKLRKGPGTTYEVVTTISARVPRRYIE